MSAKKTAKKCMHCGHPIKKVFFMSQGQSMWEYRHTIGGRICRVKGEYHGLTGWSCCVCEIAEPAKEGGD